MNDLLQGHEPPITITDQLRCVEREIVMRQGVYARRVDNGTMKQPEADREIELMRAVRRTLRKVAGLPE